MDKNDTKERVALQLILLAFAVVVLFLAVWQIPILQTRNIKTTGNKTSFDYENSARATLVQTLGGVFFCITSFLTWRNLRNSEKTYQLSDEKQVTERFTKAVEMLSSDQIEVRLGGIYSLERISKDSDKDFVVITEVLAAFVRTHSPAELISQNEKNLSYLVSSEKSEKYDIQAILSVLKRRSSENREIDELKVNLSKTDLDRMYMSGLLLKSADFYGATLRHTNLLGANLDYASLENANIQGANLQYTSLKKTNFRNIKWNHETKWPSKDELRKASNLPKELKEYIKLE